MEIVRIIIIIGALLPSFAFANLFGQLCFEEQSSFSISNTSSELLPPDNCWGCGGQQVIHIPERLQLMKSKNTLTMLWEDGGTNTCSSTASFGNLQPYKSSVEYKVRLYKSGTRDSRIYTTTSRAFSLEVQPGYNYNFRVQACDKELNKCSLYSSSSNSVFVTGGPPAKPTSQIQIRASRYVTTLEFERIQYASFYKIKQSDLFTNQANITNVSGTNVTIPSISNRSYTYSYAACNDEGCSEFSDSAIAINFVSPSVPTNTKLEQDSNSLFASWDLVSVSHDEFPNGVKYVYQLMKDGEVIQESATEEQVIEITSPGRGEYSYKIKTCAKGSLNCSGYSNNPETIFFKPVPPTPDNVNLNFREIRDGIDLIHEFRLDWDPVTPNFLDFPIGVNYKIDICIDDYVQGQQFTSNSSFVDRYYYTEENRGPQPVFPSYNVSACDLSDINNCSEPKKVGSSACISNPNTPSQLLLSSASNVFNYSFNHEQDNLESYPQGLFFLVRLYKNEELFKTISTEAKSGVISDIETGKYKFNVIACDKVERRNCSTLSDYSNEVEVNLLEHASTTSSDIEDSQLPAVTAPTVNDIGTIKGQAGVSGGAATYNIPIELPPGRAGMQPNVSLSYSSRAGNGIAGVGWSLSAGSSITRCSATFAQDGFAQNPQYNSNDKLCLNGQRLMLADGSTYGANGAVYRTEIDSFVKVTQSSGLNSSNTSFTVQYKNGRTAVFGESDDSRVVHEGKSAAYSWLIQYEYDATGNNYINYEYDEFGAGEKLITSINYTAGSNTTEGYQRVTFSYTELDDALKKRTYLAGGLYEKTRILSRITTYSNSTEVAKYTLATEDSLASGRKLLSSITLCYKTGEETEVCLPATEFDWSNNNLSYELDLVKYNSDGSTTYVKTFEDRRPTDFLFEDYLPNGDKNKDGVRDWKTASISPEGELIDEIEGSDNFCVWNRAKFDYDCFFNDFDLDGKSDEINNDISNTSYNYDVTYSSTDRLVENILPVNLSPNNSIDQIKSISDFNGDSWPDIYLVRLSNNSVYYELYLHSGTSSGRPYSSNNIITIATQNFSEVNTRLLQIDVAGDMDGNGTVDFIQTASIRQGHYYSAVILGEVSDSGELSYADASDIYSLEEPEPENLDNWYHFQTLADINGDGLPDLLGIDPDNVSNSTAGLQYQLNTGSGFEAPVSLGGNSRLPIASFGESVSDNDNLSTTYYKAKYPINFMDVDGDGDVELLIPSSIVAIGCTWVGEINSGRSSLNQRCGSQIYAEYTYSDNGTRKSTALLDPRKYDDSIYSYNALHFNVSGDSISGELEETDLKGTVGEIKSMDATGDGLTDLVFAFGPRPSFAGSPQGKYNSVNTETPEFGNKFGIWINRNKGTSTEAGGYQAPDVLQSVTNGVGLNASWLLKPLSTTMYEDKLYDVDIRDTEGGFAFSSSMHVVAEFSQDNGTGSMNTTQYKYRGAVYSPDGRGFLGFRAIVEKDLTKELVTQIDFHQEFPYQGKIQRQATFKLDSYSNDVTPLGDNDSSAINLTTYTWSDNPSHDFSDIYHIYPSSIVKIVNDLDGNLLTTHRTQNNGIDEFGNITDSTVTIDDTDLTSYETETVRVYENDANTWFINKLTSSKVEKTSEDKRTLASDIKTVATIFSDYHANRKPRTVELKEDSITGDLLKTTTTVFNDYGLPTSITETATTYAIDGSDQESNRTTSINYTKDSTSVTADGYFPFTVTNAKGHKVTTYTNPATGQPTTVRKQIGASAHLNTVYGYDGFNRLYSVQTGGQPIRYTAVQTPDDRAPANAVMQIVTKSAGTPTSKEYKDKLGRTLRTAVQGFGNGSWIYNDVHYDNEGQVTFESVPFINATSPTTLGVSYSEFDVLGRPKYKVTSQSCANLVDGTMTAKYTYKGFTTEIDVKENCNSLTLPKMFRTYNSQKQLMSTVDAIGGTTTYSYNSLGLPTVIQDANGDSIVASYDSFGRKTSVNDPNQGYTQFTYNGFGELQAEERKQTSASTSAHTIVRYAVDELGRVTERRATGETDLTYNYDTASNGYGQLGSESSNDVTRTYAFDSFGRPTSTTIAGSGKSYTISTLYDANSGRVKGLRYPNNLTVKYEYNARGYLTHIRNAASGYVYQNITGMDKFGNISSSTLGNGLRESNLYYAVSGQMANKIVNKTGQGQLLNINYSAYDGFGNLKGLTVSSGPIGDRHTFTERFEYDHLHRLTSNQIAGITTTSYTYDNVGNITSKSDYATTYDYDTHLSGYSGGGDNAVKKVQKTDGSWVGFSYDARGNMTKGDGLTEALYNAMDKPTSITKNGITNTFVYGPDHMRFKQTKSTGSTIYYADKLYEEEVKNGETTWRAYIGDVAVVSKSDNGLATIRYTHRDRLGSARLFTDRNGNVEAQRNFDPFGKPREASGGLKFDSKLGDLNTAKTRRGFTDHEHLDDMELIHMNGRVYDYNLGRFMSVDPYVQSPGNSQSINPYSYIMNNPLAGTDPTGYCSAETGTRIKSCVDVVVTNSDTGEVSTTSMNSKHSNFAGNVTNYVASKLGNGAQLTSMTAHTKGGDTMDLMNQQTLVKDVNSHSSSEQESNGWSFIPKAHNLPTLPQGVVDFAAGFGDTLSFGATDWIRSKTGSNSVVDKQSDSYSSGELSGVGLSLAFGGAHLGRNALFQTGKTGGISLGLSRLSSDRRTWGSVRNMWSTTAGNGKPWLKANGQHLHHWLIPQRSARVGRNIKNAGFNYMPISGSFNSWMNGSTRGRRLVERGFRLPVIGIYGAPITAVAIND